MGGSSYDRDVYSSSSSSNWGASTASEGKFAEYLDASMLPNKKVLVSHTKTPVIVVLDVTGSNTDFARIVYDKLPMFFGQISMQNYLDDFDISFCAVGDAFSDSYPMQIGNFAAGIALDDEIGKIVLEGGGGGQRKESYELMAYYLSEKTRFEPDAKPIIFFIGDESMYPNLDKKQVEKFGMKLYEEGVDAFQLLREKVNDNVFFLQNDYCGNPYRYYVTDVVTEDWKKALAPNHVIKVNEEKSIIDIMLGIVAIQYGSRDLSSYIDDMVDRGQSDERIENVKKSLEDWVNNSIFSSRSGVKLAPAADVEFDPFADDDSPAPPAKPKKASTKKPKASSKKSVDK